MWRIRISITLFCALLLVNRVSSNNKQNASSDGKPCPHGTAFIEGLELPENSSCKLCRMCPYNQNFSYLSCESITQLKDCHEEIFLHTWRLEMKLWDKGGPLKGPRQTERKVPVINTTSKPTTLVPGDHLPLPLVLGILVLVFAVGLLISIGCCISLRKKKKERISIYDAISSRRRPQVEDENYIRYTKDPTSSRRKERVRASWPRANTRSEHRYLLDAGTSEPVHDPGVLSTGTSNRRGAEENPDNNSAHYVFIQTFSAPASCTPVPVTLPTLSCDSSETSLPNEMPLAIVNSNGVASSTESSASPSTISNRSD